MEGLPRNSKNLRNLTRLKNTVRDTTVNCTNVECYNEFQGTGVWFEVSARGSLGMLSAHILGYFGLSIWTVLAFLPQQYTLTYAGESTYHLSLDLARLHQRALHESNAAIH